MSKAKEIADRLESELRLPRSLAIRIARKLGALAKPTNLAVPVNEYRSITHKFSIGGHEGHMTVGMYEDGGPAEIFVKLAKEGSTLAGIMDGFALLLSSALQHGVPLKALIDKFIHTRFEPSGYTGNAEIPYAKSILDYLARWLGGKFVSTNYLIASEANKVGVPITLKPSANSESQSETNERAENKANTPDHGRQNAPVDEFASCVECGSVMSRFESYFVCRNCGSTLGASGKDSEKMPSPPAPQRRKLPPERKSITHKFMVGGHEGYLIVGMYDDGSLAEIFVKMAKEGSTLSGMMDGFALAASIALQYGVPTKNLVDKIANMRFEPSGFTGNPEIPYAKSIYDYMARWIGIKFISRDYAVVSELGSPMKLETLRGSRPKGGRRRTKSEKRN